jgi:hypothetical protein
MSRRLLVCSRLSVHRKEVLLGFELLQGNRMYKQAGRHDRAHITVMTRSLVGQVQVPVLLW